MELIDRLAALSDGDLINAVQAAAENTGTTEERLEKGLAEIAG